MKKNESFPNEGLGILMQMAIKSKILGIGDEYRSIEPLKESNPEEYWRRLKQLQEKYGILRGTQSKDKK